jgi:hypothetical protein
MQLMFEKPQSGVYCWRIKVVHQQLNVISCAVYRLYHCLVNCRSVGNSDSGCPLGCVIKSQEKEAIYAWVRESPVEWD